MTNRERYANEIRIALSQNTFAEFYDKYINPAYESGEFYSLHHHERAIYTILWLDEEYTEPEVDWSKVENDTPILVRRSDDGCWKKRYFAKVENDKVIAWNYGRTSWNNNGCSAWEQAKLAEEGDTDENKR